MRRFKDPATSGVILFAGLILAGFVVIGLAYWTVSGTLTVAYQVPALVSGGLGGLALIVFGAALTYVHVSRRVSAVHAAKSHDLLRDLQATADAVLDRL